MGRFLSHLGIMYTILKPETQTKNAINTSTPHHSNREEKRNKFSSLKCKRTRKKTNTARNIKKTSLINLGRDKSSFCAFSFGALPPKELGESRVSPSMDI